MNSARLLTKNELQSLCSGARGRFAVGDISTLYEYSDALRDGHLPPGMYVLGVGPLYPQFLRPFLWILGESYLTFKVAAVTFSLLALLLLYRFARRMVDRNTALAATAIGGTMSWWLVYSRLGDLQALVPALTIATLSATVLAIRTRDEWTTSAFAGGLASLGIYLYGNTFVLPIIVAVTFLVAWRLRRIGWRDLAAMGGASLVVAVPMLRELVADSCAVLHGYVGQRMVDGADLLPTLVRGYGEALWAYVRVGDGSFRGNVPFAAHVDHLTAALAVVGIVWWLRGARRLQGIFLVGSFLLLHLPSVLAGTHKVPSVSRTTADRAVGRPVRGRRPELGRDVRPPGGADHTRHRHRRCRRPDRRSERRPLLWRLRARLAVREHVDLP